LQDVVALKKLTGMDPVSEMPVNDEPEEDEDDDRMMIFAEKMLGIVEKNHQISEHDSESDSKEPSD